MLHWKNNNDIIYRQYDNGNKPKNKIANPYASYITNTAVGYFLGKPVSYTNIENFEAINDLLVYNTLSTNFTKYGKEGTFNWHFKEIVGNNFNNIYLSFSSSVNEVAAFIGRTNVIKRGFFALTI